MKSSRLGLRLPWRLRALVASCADAGGRRDGRGGHRRAARPVRAGAAGSTGAARGDRRGGSTRRQQRHRRHDRGRGPRGAGRHHGLAGTTGRGRHRRSRRRPATPGASRGQPASAGRPARRTRRPRWIAGSSAGSAGTAGRGGSPVGGAGVAGAGGPAAPAAAPSAVRERAQHRLGQLRNDVPNPNIDDVQDDLPATPTTRAGASIRWWFHTNGTVTPGYDSSGKAMPLQQSHNDGVKAILVAAASHGVRIVISLWSFDMLQDNADRPRTPTTSAQAARERHQPAGVHRQLPHAAGDGPEGHAGLYAYEIFNEPEGMAPQAAGRPTGPRRRRSRRRSTGSSLPSTPPIPASLVTSSAQTFDYCSNGQRQDELVLRQRPAHRGGQAERHARLLRGPLLHARTAHSDLAVHAPGLVLGPRQEAGDGRVLRAGHRRHGARATSTRSSIPPATTAPGRGSTTTATHRP